MAETEPPGIRDTVTVFEIELHPVESKSAPLAVNIAPRESTWANIRPSSPVPEATTSQDAPEPEHEASPVASDENQKSNGAVTEDKASPETEPSVPSPQPQLEGPADVSVRRISLREKSKSKEPSLAKESSGPKEDAVAEPVEFSSSGRPLRKSMPARFESAAPTPPKKISPRNRKSAVAPPTDREQSPAGKVDEDEEEEEEEEESDGTYEVEKIMSHKRTRSGKKKEVTLYLIRWLGYGPNSDTWEPESNILGDSAKQMLRDYWKILKKQKANPNAAATPAESPTVPEPEQAAAAAGKSNRNAPKRKSAPNKAALRSASEALATPSTPIAVSSETAETTTPTVTKAKSCSQDRVVPETTDEIVPVDVSMEAEDGTERPMGPPGGGPDSTEWCGLKETDLKNVKREMKNLFVADRIPSLSEKLLAEVGTTSSGRVTRSSLKPLKEDVEPPRSSGSSTRQSHTPEPPTKRSRQAESPGTTKRYSPEPPPARKPRRSAQGSSSTPSAVGEEKEPPTSTGVQKRPITVLPKVVKREIIELVEERRRPSDMGEPPSRAMLKPKRSGVVPPVSQVAPSSVVPMASKPAPTTTQAVTAVQASKHILDPLLVRNASKSAAADKDSGFVELTNASFEALRNLPCSTVNMETLYNEITSTPVMDDIDLSVTPKYDKFVQAVLSGDVDMVYSMIKHPRFAHDINKRDSEGRTLIHHIASFKCTQAHTYDTIMELLADKKADLSIAEPSERRTALHIAVDAGNACLATILVSRGSPINTVDKHDLTPLMSALLAKNVFLVTKLLRSGANVRNVMEFMRRHNLPESLRLAVAEHRHRIMTAMDSARRHILHQATPGIKSAIESSVYIAPLHESETIDYEFDLNVTEVMMKQSNYLFFECCVLEVAPLDGEVAVRMWQQSPIKRILINDVEPTNLHKTTNFISLPPHIDTRNTVHIDLMNHMYRGTAFCLVARLAHVFLAGFSRSRRLDPTIGNLLPLMMNETAGYKTNAPLAMRELARNLRPKYFRDPVMPLSRQTTPARQTLAHHLVTSNNDRADPRTLTRYRCSNNAIYSVPEVRPVRGSTMCKSSAVPQGFVPIGRSPLAGSMNNGVTTQVVQRNRLPVVRPLTAASNRIALNRPSGNSGSQRPPVLHPQNWHD